MAKGDHTAHTILKTEGGVEDVLRPNPTQLSKGEVTVLIDVGDNETNGIHVGGEHDFGAITLFMYDQVSQGVDIAFVGVRFCQALEGRGDLPFLPGGTVAGVKHLDHRKIIHVM